MFNRPSPLESRHPSSDDVSLYAPGGSAGVWGVHQFVKLSRFVKASLAAGPLTLMIWYLPTTILLLPRDYTIAPHHKLANRWGAPEVQVGRFTFHCYFLTNKWITKPFTNHVWHMKLCLLMLTTTLRIQQETAYKGKMRNIWNQGYILVGRYVKTGC